MWVKNVEIFLKCCWGIQMTENELIEEFARRIKAAYEWNRAKAAGTSEFQANGEKWKKTWEKAARLCLRERIPPESFVEAQFMAIFPFPYITALGTENAVRRYYSNRKISIENTGQTFLMQLKAVEKQLLVGRAFLEILNDKNENFEPLFKCAALFMNGAVPDEETQRAAVMQYFMSPSYQKLYGPFFPEDFRKRIELFEAG